MSRRVFSSKTSAAAGRGQALELSGNKSLIRPSPGPRTPPETGIFLRTIVHLDPDSDLFMKVADRAYQDHERSLVPCAKCGRKFFPDRIEIHQMNCAASKLQESSSQRKTSSSSPASIKGGTKKSTDLRAQPTVSASTPGNSGKLPALCMKGPSVGMRSSSSDSHSSKYFYASNTHRRNSNNNNYY